MATGIKRKPVSLTSSANIHIAAGVGLTSCATASCKCLAVCSKRNALDVHCKPMSAGNSVRSLKVDARIVESLRTGSSALHQCDIVGMLLQFKIEPFKHPLKVDPLWGGEQCT
jgi:hypothetical protein